MKPQRIFRAAALVLGCLSLTANGETWQTGLTAYYPLDGTAHDASGSGRHGIVHGATPTTNRFGSEARALDFNWILAHIECPPAVYFGPQFTISAWVNVRSIRFWARVMDFGNGQDADNVFLATSQALSGVPLVGVYQASFMRLGGAWPSELPLKAVTFSR